MTPAFLVHEHNPAELIETAFFRVQQERMIDVPILNPALSVEAIDVQRWQGHWLGILITPWCMSVLLVPGKTDDWETVGDNKRRFIKFPAGEFAFLGSEEEGLGEFQSCALFSPMDRFASQSETVMTARASLIALLTPPIAAETGSAANTDPAAPASPSRRRFFAPFVRSASGS